VLIEVLVEKGIVGLAAFLALLAPAIPRQAARGPIG
jgi:O-antigen ligase